jgi:DNA anti-recombination protein RmuC
MTTDRPIKEEPEAPPDLEELLAEARSQKLESHLKAWAAELARLKTRVEQADPEAQAEYAKQAQILRAKLNQVQDKLRKLQQAGADASYEMIRSVDEMVAELRKSFESDAETFQ